MRYDNAKITYLPTYMPIFHAKMQCNGDLSEHRIDIWRYTLKHSNDWSSILSTEEKNRAARFYFEKHRRRFMQSHGILRTILAHYLNIAPENISLKTDHHGKPYIENSNVFFNLSHSGDYALVAIGLDSALGIDLEKFSSRSYRGLAQQMFSEAENQQLLSCPQYLEAAVFFSIWSQKEAFIKACGLGLHYPTKTFSVEALSTHEYCVYDTVHCKDWRLFPFYPLPGFAGAICYDGDYQTLNFYQF